LFEAWGAIVRKGMHGGVSCCNALRNRPQTQSPAGKVGSSIQSSGLAWQAMRANVAQLLDLRVCYPSAALTGAP